MAADVGQEELKAVGGADGRARRGRLRAARASRPPRPRLANLEADRLELARQLLDVGLVELVLEGECLELGRLDVAALLGSLDEGARPLGLE